MKNRKNKDNTFETIGDVASQLIKSAIVSLAASAKEFDVEVSLTEYVWAHKGKVPKVSIRKYNGRVGDILDDGFVLLEKNDPNGKGGCSVNVRYLDILPGDFISKDGSFKLKVSRVSK